MDQFFILGCPRSGTTMLQQALNRHSRIVIPPETKFFVSFFRRSRACQLRHIRRLNEDLGIDLPVPGGRLATPGEGREYFQVMARQYVQRLGKPGVSCFGEKSPEHSGYLPLIRQLFPAAKLIVLYRDGRDVALSLTGVPWASEDVYVNFLVWLHYTSILQRGVQANCPHLYCLRYEDLVSSPDRTLAGVVRFLGLPEEPAVAGGWGNRDGIPEREYSWKGRALQRITPARVGLFRRELRTGQLEILERLGRHVLPSLGYPLLTGGDRPLSSRFLLSLLCSLSRFLWRLPLSSIVDQLWSGIQVWPSRLLAPFPSDGRALELSDSLAKESLQPC